MPSPPGHHLSAVSDGDVVPYIETIVGAGDDETRIPERLSGENAEPARPPLECGQ